MKRKIISVMLTGTMIAGMLTGCGSDSSSKSSSSVISGSSETETETTNEHFGSECGIFHFDRCADPDPV